MRIHIRNVDQVPQVAGQELLGALIVLEFALGRRVRRKQRKG
jgi:hypothetical protein